MVHEFARSSIMNAVQLTFIISLALVTSWGSCEVVDNSGPDDDDDDDDGDDVEDDSLSGGRVINGETADIERYPYVVEIQHYNTTGNFWYFRCVGSIMNQKTILTACHCIREEPFTNDNVRFKELKEVRVLAGVSNRYAHSKAQIGGVKQFFPHPQCSSPPASKPGYYTDVAVILLNTDLDLSADGVKRLTIVSKDPIVAIEEQTKLVEAGARCESMGWGLTEQPPSLKSVDELQVTGLHLVGNKKCAELWCQHDKYYCNDNLDDYNYVCAVNDNSTMCRGDSGGPLVCNGLLFGVDILGDDKCRFEIPTIFADMNSVLYFKDLF